MIMHPPAYSARCEFRLSREHQAFLYKVALSEGVTVSCLVRMVVTRFLEDRRRFEP